MALKYASKLSIAALLLFRLSSAQVPGTALPNLRPRMLTQKCTRIAGCVTQTTSVTLDWNLRPIHDSVGVPCFTRDTGVDRNICPNHYICSQRCYVENVDYTFSGVTTSGDSVTLRQYSDYDRSDASPRVYLLDTDGNYVLLKLLGGEISFDVDVAELPCGENANMFLSEMPANGGKSTLNPGGAEFGGAYCDGRCTYQYWKGGKLDAAGPSCCNQVHLLEANRLAVKFTPHVCIPNSNICDQDGCGFNPYTAGYHNYWGAGGTVDTLRRITVLTQFITDDGTANGNLKTIRRKYIQNGQVIASAAVGGDNIDANNCPSGDPYGGFRTLGDALRRGMVLGFSLWNDPVDNMNWLDSGENGPCDPQIGSPEYIFANYPIAKVTFSKVRWGELDSTTSNTNPITTTSSTSRSPLTTKQSSTTSPIPNGPTQTRWGQCGGIGYGGPTQCEAGTACYTQNPYWAQCLS
ncbi:hypothetical protein TWF281_010980 [Arthrobotrys megalospora]